MRLFLTLRRGWGTRIWLELEKHQTGIGEDMEEPETLELYELSFLDLVLLSSTGNDSSPSSPEERERYQLISTKVMEALGPTGPGLLCITGVPGTSVLRRKLLPLSRKLALLDPDSRKSILKEHNLGSDVPLKNPDRNVSSFAMQLKYAQSPVLKQGQQCHDETGYLKVDQDSLDVAGTVEFQEDEFKNLGGAFKELGFCMMELGLSIARICDREIGGRELEESLLESSAAKGRLIHYHSIADNRVLREAGRRKQSAKTMANKKGDKDTTQQESSKINMDRNVKDIGSCGIYFNLWQQWHYDYGLFTVLTNPMFLSSSSARVDPCVSVSSSKECSSPSGHSYLQIYHPSKNKVCTIKSPPDSFIIQIGESADILSKGKLRSTLHCVCRPKELENLSRETFVVFLQPAWNKSFSVSDCTMEHLKLESEQMELSDSDNFQSETKLNELALEIQKIVPKLSSRLKDGMTFAEFSRETTKQYYSGSGLQSNK